jgi:hypothetical protein
LQMREDREKEGAGEGKESRREIDFQPPTPTELFATSLRQILWAHSLQLPGIISPLLP